MVRHRQTTHSGEWPNDDMGDSLVLVARIYLAPAACVWRYIGYMYIVNSYEKSYSNRFTLTKQQSFEFISWILYI